MSAIVRHVDGVRAAHRTLIDRIADLDDERIRRPSLLPGWTAGHVLTHLARNADSFERLLGAALRGDAGVQYPGGAAQRNGDIELGATRAAADLLADVHESAAALDALWDSITDEMWDRPVEMFSGRATIGDLPFRRWREVMVHLLDLDVGFTSADWPEEYVRTDLRLLRMAWGSRRPMGLSDLPAAAEALDDRARLAWLLGRAVVPGLGDAGIMS